MVKCVMQFYDKVTRYTTSTFLRMKLGDELAKREKISPSYLTRVLRLTLLAPEIIEDILDGRLGPQATLAALMDPFPPLWADQMFDPRFFRP